MLPVFILVLLATSPHLIAGQSPTTTPCPIVLPTPLDPVSRVIGGTRAPGIPYVAVVLQDGNFWCTGAVISSTAVLTSGHCVTDNPSDANRYAVRVGGSTVKEGEKISVKSFERHPKYNKLRKFDMAVLILKKPINNVMSIPLAKRKPPLWSYTRLTGFGWTGFNDRSDGKLRRIDVPISPCKWYLYVDTLTNFDLKGTTCAGGSTVSNCTGCFGDSGGPWVQYDANENPVLVGLHSASAQCDLNEKVSIFVDIKTISKWLKRIGVAFQKARKPLKHVSLDFVPSPPKGFLNNASN